VEQSCAESLLEPRHMFAHDRFGDFQALGGRGEATRLDDFGEYGDAGKGIHDELGYFREQCYSIRLIYRNSATPYLAYRTRAAGAVRVNQNGRSDHADL